MNSDLWISKQLFYLDKIFNPSVCDVLHDMAWYQKPRSLCSVFFFINIYRVVGRYTHKRDADCIYQKRFTILY